MLIDGININYRGFSSITYEELKHYVDYVKAREPNVTSIDVKLGSDGFADIFFIAHNQPFERIRRITGYLTGDVRSWNDAKRAEQHDRVKHNVLVYDAKLIVKDFK